MMWPTSHRRPGACTRSTTASRWRSRAASPLAAGVGRRRKRSVAAGRSDRPPGRGDAFAWDRQRCSARRRQMSLLELDGISVTYGDAVLALEDVSLVVEEGASVSLLGANGAGKTTTLRAIGGLLRYHGGQIRSGQIRFDGKPVRSGSATSLVEAGIAQSLEGRQVFGELTVEENLRVGAWIRRARRLERQTRDEVLELFPRLVDRLHGRAGLLSGSEQQMLAIARALMARPRLLRLDEPSLGLAPLIIAEIAASLATITAQGTAI